MDAIERAWRDGRRADVGAWLRKQAVERFENVTAAKRAISAHHERSAQWVHTVFKGVPKGIQGYAMVAASILEEPPTWLVPPTLALATTVVLPSKAFGLAPREEALDVVEDQHQEVVHRFEELARLVASLGERVEQLEQRPAWADELVSHQADVTPQHAFEEDEELGLEAAVSHPKGTLLYRTDGEVFFVTHAGRAFVATEAFGLPLGEEELPVWDPKRARHRY